MDRIIIMIVYIKFLHHKNQHKLFFTKDMSMDWYRGFKTDEKLSHLSNRLLYRFVICLEFSFFSIFNFFKF